MWLYYIIRVVFGRVSDLVWDGIILRFGFGLEWDYFGFGLDLNMIPNKIVPNF